MSITGDDLRAAVRAGTISEAQAASISALADARRGVRENIDGLDEPFELFRGFNEIFIVVGMGILASGWFGLTAIAMGLNQNLSSTGMIYGLIGMAFTAALARYFTLKRRMVAPSIALAILFGMSALQTTASLLVVMFDPGTWGWALLAATGLMLVYWRIFHVPFAMFLIGAGVFTSALILTAAQTGGIDDPRDIFLLSADGSFAFITIGLGLLGLAVAMYFDMSDPHRVTRRSQNGFWLHVIAAPAIVNTVALSLFQSGSAAAEGVLFLFLIAMAIFAIVIDRRSFLISGIGYIVALTFTVIGDNEFLVILLLGLGLVLLGAQWERWRRGLMNGLPAFPGKNRLPPWEGSTD